MAESKPIVYLVDDEPQVLRALSRVLRAGGFDTLAYASPRQFLDEHDAGRPGCAVLDLAMPELDGLALQQRLSRDGADPRPIVFLSGHADVPRSVEAMKQGAVDFLTKPVDDRELTGAVERAIEIDRRERRERAARAALTGRYAKLTDREREVYSYVISGLLNKQIAAALGTTEGTVKVHRGRVMRKMGAVSLADLVRFADRVGVERIDRGSPLELASPLHQSAMEQRSSRAVV